MKLPTIHLIIEQGKSACGKRKGVGCDEQEFKKRIKRDDWLGLCIKCQDIVKSKSSKKTSV